jgi:hypothetical protein
MPGDMNPPLAAFFAARFALPMPFGFFTMELPRVLASVKSWVASTIPALS